MDRKEIKITSDGSHTIYLPELDETYHSVHGAMQEAEHVFIDAGLMHFKGSAEVKILEVGFGTGLNAFLTLLEVLNGNQQVKYFGVEAFPLSFETIKQLNYVNQLKLTSKKQENFFEQIHLAGWNQENILDANFSLTKLKTKIENFDSSEKFDLIYFDAFGPRVQPEMWEENVLRKMYDVLDSKGALVTYCAKGSVKRLLKEVGFEVETLPGPPGKREMTRATKC